MVPHERVDLDSDYVQWVSFYAFPALRARAHSKPYLRFCALFTAILIHPGPPPFLARNSSAQIYISHPTMACYDIIDYSFDSLDSFDYLSEHSSVSTAATSPGSSHNLDVFETPRQQQHCGGNGLEMHGMVTPATLMSRSCSTTSYNTPFVSMESFGKKLTFTPQQSDCLLTPQSIGMDRSQSLPEIDSDGFNPFYVAPPPTFNLDDVQPDLRKLSPPPTFSNPFYKPQRHVGIELVTEDKTESSVSPVLSPEPQLASPVSAHSVSPLMASPVSASVKAAQMALMGHKMQQEQMHMQQQHNHEHTQHSHSHSHNHSHSHSHSPMDSPIESPAPSLFKRSAEEDVSALYSIIHTPHTPTVVPHNGVLSVSPEFEFTVCEKKFVCKHCDKRFKRHEHLKRHMKIHTDDRPFICEIEGCNRKFSRSDNFRAHRRTHMKKGGRNHFVEGLQDQYTHRAKRRCLA